MTASARIATMFPLVIFAIIGAGVRECLAQDAGAFDLGDHREGQLPGQISPLNIFAIVLGCLAALVACGVTGICAYFTWRRYTEEPEQRTTTHKYATDFA